MALTKEDLENILKKKSDEAIECFKTAIIINFNEDSFLTFLKKKIMI